MRAGTGLRRARIGTDVIHGDDETVMLIASQITDPGNARTMYLAAAGLALLGVTIAAITVWWWRSSAVDHPTLAPLEVMGLRRWLGATYTERQRLLEEARPAGALGLAERPNPEEVDISDRVGGEDAWLDELRSEASVNSVDGVDGHEGSPVSASLADFVSALGPIDPGLSVTPHAGEADASAVDERDDVGAWQSDELVTISKAPLDDVVAETTVDVAGELAMTLDPLLRSQR